MSDLNKDSEVLEGKRKPLEGADAGLRDQIEDKLYKKLEDLEIGRKVQMLWRRGLSERSEWHERQKQYLSDLNEFINDGADGPFAGSSQLHVPVTLSAAKTMHARFLQALIGIEPYFTLKPRRADSIDRARTVQDVMSYSIQEWGNEYQGAAAELDTWVWNWCTTGQGLIKDRWVCKYERFMDVVQELEDAPSKTTTDPKTQQEVIIPQKRLVEKEQFVTKKTYEGPSFEALDNEDVVIIGGKGDPQQADSLHHGQFLTASELWTLVDRKIFREDAVREIIEAGPDFVTSDENTDIKSQRALEAGQSVVDTEADLDRYHIIESYLWADVDGSGINSHIVTWVHRRSGKLCHANYLRRLNRAGERPIHKIEFMRRPGQQYPFGLCEMLHPIAVEIDAMHNMRVDFGMLATMPFGFYRASSSLNPETIYYEPGALIPLDNPQSDVYFPNLGNRTAFGFQEEQALQQIIERLISLNDMTYGMMNGSQGATRTATGAQGLINEGNTNLDVFLKRLQRGWKQALKYRLHMLQQRIPKGLSFKVTGEAGDDYWVYIQSELEIAGDFDFEVAPNSAASSPTIQQQVAQQTLQLVMNPLLLQTGIVSPGNIYEAVKQQLKVMGVKDFARYCTKPANYQYVPSPEDEANAILRGIPIPVLPQADHQGFLDYFQMIYKSDELLGQFSKEQAGMLKQQADKHQQMLQAIQAQQAQVANQNQMVLNQQMGAPRPQGGMNGPQTSNGAGGNPQGSPGQPQ